ncbi:MAG: polyprenyl synthetase family protein [Candidatus Binatia bacterium]
MTIERELRERAERVDVALERLLADVTDAVEPRLLESMRYSLLTGGKRIRPILVLAAAELAGGDAGRVMPFACAVEMVHTYSLVHDDLPAMDDDPVRRGRPSNHVVFGDGIAILAGDALLTEAFAVMSRAAGSFPAERVVAAIAELALASGAQGMIGGQTADLLAEGAVAALERIESIHRRKTGALLRAAIRIGAILGGADAELLSRLTRYAERIGLAFQVADDLLDETGRTEATGKAARRDRELGKSTYPSVLGVEEARAALRRLLDEAMVAVDGLGERAELLRVIARTIVSRAL